MSIEKNSSNASGNNSAESRPLSPKDAATRSMEMVYGQAALTDLEVMSDDNKVNSRLISGASEEGELNREAGPRAEGDTPVDPAAPPADIVNGTDLINGYNGDK
ncbi:MAG: hypothetical protein K0S39_2862 [Paenibacillus sp.]|jgi:hypothetical protein|nr:hypothetical protein [Paenibacillus sp.]